MSLVTPNVPMILPFLSRKGILVVYLVASITILLLWPLMLVIAVAVKLESRGPVIYRSLRVGKIGAPLACYKFRTMIPGASLLRQRLLHLSERRGPFFKMANDPRVTRLGRFLRKYSLDELPQLWNVLKGDMRSEEHTSELQSLRHLVCRLLLEKKKHERSRLVGMTSYESLHLQLAAILSHVVMDN